MKTYASLLAAAVLLTTSLAALRAEDPLNDVLGPNLDPKADVKKPEPKKAQPAPVAPEMVSPEATKKIDDEDLAKKLTGEKDLEDKFKAVVTRMGQSEERLKERDPGAETLEIQRRIVVDLDILIEIAKKQQQQQQQQSSSSQKPGQKREQSQGQQQGQGQGQGKGDQEGGSNAAQNEGLRGGGASAPQSNGQDIREKSSEWGNLPPKERDLVSTGANEQYLEAYKTQIQKYYETLAEIGKAAKDR